MRGRRGVVGIACRTSHCCCGSAPGCQPKFWIFLGLGGVVGCCVLGWVVLYTLLRGKKRGLQMSSDVETVIFWWRKGRGAASDAEAGLGLLSKDPTLHYRVTVTYILTGLQFGILIVQVMLHLSFLPQQYPYPHGCRNPRSSAKGSERKSP